MATQIEGCESVVANGELFGGCSEEARESAKSIVIESGRRSGSTADV